MHWIPFPTTHPLLQESVELILQRRLPVSKEEYPPFMRVLPRSGASLFLDFRGTFAKEGESWLNRAVNGYHRNYYYLARLSNGEVDQMIVLFTATGLARFVGTDANRLSRRLVDADRVLGPAFAAVYERLAATESLAQRAQIMERYLLSRLREPERSEALVHTITHLLRNETAPPSGSHLSSHTGIGLRQLERHFRKWTGTSMRSYALSLRFELFRSLSERSSHLPLSHLAQETGFYDQPHFIRKIKEMSGLTPGEFLSSSDPCEISDQKLLHTLHRSRFDTIPEP